jgi:hypothetical protein
MKKSTAAQIRRRSMSFGKRPDSLKGGPMSSTFRPKRNCSALRIEIAEAATKQADYSNEPPE